MEFLSYYAANWIDAFKASTGYNMPIFGNIVPKPMPILSNDPVLASGRQAGGLQQSDKWTRGRPAIPARPGRRRTRFTTDFVINDMMTKAATGTMTAEECGQMGDARV